MLITYEANPSPCDLKLLTDGICAEAYKKRGLYKIEPFCFFLRDKKLKIIGGIHGVIYYGCMYIDELWVEECYRGKGYGKKLMLKAEELAKVSCNFITVNTMDFEARPFYEKLGYIVEFERGGYFESSTIYFLKKNL